MTPSETRVELSIVQQLRDATNANLLTPEFDQRVDEVEDGIVEESIAALTRFDLDECRRGLALVTELRTHYMRILDVMVPSHPLYERAPHLRAYAANSQENVAVLTGFTDAMHEHRNGKPDAALAIMQGVRALPGFSSGPDSVNAGLRHTVITVGENFTGMLRRSVLDFAGARAAFDRAAVAAELLRAQVLSDLEQVPDDIRADARFMDTAQLALGSANLQIAMSRSFSSSAQHSQLMASGDWEGAASAARVTASHLLDASKAAQDGPPFLAALGALLEADSCQAEAHALAAQAALALERGALSQASDLTNQVVTHYERASRTCLNANHPIAPVMQERYLNAGFSWSVRFRSQIERERHLTEKVERAESDLRNLIAALSGALAPAGVVVNNATELVTSVEQQVAVTGRIEHNVREVLRDLGNSLESLPIPAEVLGPLVAEAKDLAVSEAEGASFLGRARMFGETLRNTLERYAVTGNAVMDILQKLSIIG